MIRSLATQSQGTRDENEEFAGDDSTVSYDDERRQGGLTKSGSCGIPYSPLFLYPTRRWVLCPALVHDPTLEVFTEKLRYILLPLPFDMWRYHKKPENVFSLALYVSPLDGIK